jgi:ectoine hydroxylase-related dioxygenase (phytanoyl-CoA dioxygenase family)
MRAVVGDSAFPHPLKVARISYPTEPHITTPPHQDFNNNQGSPRLTATWIPLGDCPRRQGSLAVLRGSHRHGVLPLQFHLGAGHRQAVLPPELLEACTWVTDDLRAGDVLVFGALTVHAALHNSTPSLRLSVDFRYQPEGDPLTPVVLEPHFGRLSWKQVYKHWRSREHQYYWRDLDYQVVPFDPRPFEESGSEQDIWQLAFYEEDLDRRYGPA